MPYENLRDRRVVLASASPRRRELMSLLDIEFEVDEAGSGVDESCDGSVAAEDVAVVLSQRKAQHYCNTRMNSGDVVICADTVVIVDGEVLGKPKDDLEAVRMLSRLSGRKHSVVTGVTVGWQGGMVTEKAVTVVNFAKLSPEQITYYVDRYNPLDKAGAYGIQEWIGAVAINGINGSFYNVMGLPLHLLGKLLEQVPPM